MDLDAIKQIAHKLMAHRKVHAEREKGGAFYHGQRTANTALILRKIILPDEPAYDEILTVAAWFHDVGKGIEPHSRYGAVIAREALKEHCSERELEEIASLIACHPDRCPQSGEYSIWIKLLQDADLLDHYGTFAVWMDMLNSAYSGKSIEETAFYDDNMWREHCRHSRGALNFEESKAIFDEKIEFVNAFYERFRVEGVGGISE